jgi:hypothetical protein
MYAWIWRKLPFGRWGKLGGSALLVVSFTALLWFVIFPIVEPRMPFNDGQMDDSSEVVPSQAPAASSPLVSPPASTASTASSKSSVKSPSRSIRSSARN